MLEFKASKRDLFRDDKKKPHYPKLQDVASDYEANMNYQKVSKHLKDITIPVGSGSKSRQSNQFKT